MPSPTSALLSKAELYLLCSLFTLRLSSSAQQKIYRIIVSPVADRAGKKMSHPAVHPVEAPPLSIDNGGGGDAPPRVRMKDVQGMPGTPGGLALRLCQFVFATLALWVMATTSDFPSVTAFRYLVAAASLQIIWSILLAMADIYALLVKRSFRNYRVLSLFSAGDGIISTLTFAAACASAGITVLINNDLDSCSGNHCVEFETATGMAFIAWFASLPSFLLNFWSLASTSGRT
ncbi:hypothetical protein Ancab_008295 [Ancistrocladus abbreviatus]